MRQKHRRWIITAAVLVTPLIFLLCVGIGSVNYTPAEITQVLWNGIRGNLHETSGNGVANVILKIRLPRVCTVALVGAALALCGTAMQGLLKNPLADGSTLGVSSGASLGAVFAIALGLHIPMIGSIGVTVMSILFAFLSIILILTLAHILDYSLSTNTIILVGVIFSMFAGSVTNLLVTFAGDKVKNIMFWTMGSFTGTTFQDAGIVLLALIFCSILLLNLSAELNAFAMGEENAIHIGVNVRRVKLLIMIAVSILLGISVSVSGSIGFVGLVIPHIARFMVGPNHKKLLPISMWLGSIFLLLADLISRTILSPAVLPIGVITSFVGSIFFIYIFYTLRTKQ